MQLLSVITDEDSMDATQPSPDSVSSEAEAFESAEGLQDWLILEERSVRIAAKRRIQEARDFVHAYQNGLITPTEAKEKFRLYAIRWPSRLCLDTIVESEMETEATGFEPNPTGQTPYRPCKTEKVPGNHTGHHC